MMVRPLRPASWRAFSQRYVCGASHVFCYHPRLLVSCTVTFTLHITLCMFQPVYLYMSFSLVYLHVFLSSISLPPVDLRSFHISFFFFHSPLLLNKWSLSLDIKFQFPLRLDYGRSPHGYVNQRLQIQLELLMMWGVPLETCWAFNERWNNKFYYKFASCWLFLLNQIPHRY
jgi:hypothetical protein